MTTPTTVLFGLTRVGTIQRSTMAGQELGTETGPHRSDASSRATHQTHFSISSESFSNPNRSCTAVPMDQPAELQVCVDLVGLGLGLGICSLLQDIQYI